MTTDIISEDDIREIHTLLARVAYVLDSHEYERLGEVFAADVHFENPGRLVADGLPALIEAFTQIANPAVSHHVTNVVVQPIDEVTATCSMKALALRSGGNVTAAEYTDTVQKGPQGWRIAARHITTLG